VQFLAHADVFDAGFGEQVAVGGVTELLVEAASVRLRVQFDGGEPALGRPLLDRVHEQRAQAHTAGGLADRETAENPGGLCPQVQASVRRGVDDKPSRPCGDPVEQSEKVVGR
jgi:hypothetical protein